MFSLKPRHRMAGRYTIMPSQGRLNQVWPGRPMMRDHLNPPLIILYRGRVSLRSVSPSATGGIVLWLIGLGRR